MKFLLKALLISFLNGFMKAEFLNDRAYYEEKFFSWLSKYDIKPSSGAHFVKMLENFAENDDLIETHNRQVGMTYKLGHNQFSHLSFDEWREYVHLGLKRPRRLVPPGATHPVPTDPSSLPDAIDWVDLGAVTEVKNQGRCGSCWSFSTTGALEGAYKIKYGTLVSFSEQLFVDCDNSDNGCNGGLMDNAFVFAMQNGGLCTEQAYPYVAINQTCAQSLCHKVKNSAPKSYTDVAHHELALRSAVAQQPVSIGIEADKVAFQFYKSGVFSASCGNKIDHGVLIVGYGTLNGKEFYKVKNSWGPEWGMDGYILLARESARFGECGYLMAPSYPVY